MKIERIVVVNDESLSRGGAAALALLSARTFRAMGIPVTYLAADDGEGGELESLGVEIVALGDVALLQKSRLAAMVDGLANARVERFARWIEERDTPGTVYHLHNWAQILSPSVFGVLSRVADRCVIHAHDFALACPALAFLDHSTGEVCHRRPMSASCLACPCDKRSSVQKLWRTVRFLRQRQQWDVRHGPAPIVLISEAMRPFFVRSGARDDILKTIPNPVEPFTATRVEAERNRELLFVGRVAHEKGVMGVAEAARAAGLTLRVVGDGPLMGVMRERFPEVVLEGWNDRAALAEKAATARLLVSPSTWPEPFGMTFVEAIASGLPVVVSDMSLLSREIVDRAFGWSVKSPSGLGVLLPSLARDDAAIEAASRRGFEARDKVAMSAERWGDALVDLYKSVLASSSGGWAVTRDASCLAESVGWLGLAPSGAEGVRG